MNVSKQLAVDHLEVGDSIEVDDDEWPIVAIRNHAHYPVANKRTVTFENGREIDYCYGKSVRGVKKHNL